MPAFMPPKTPGDILLPIVEVDRAELDLSAELEEMWRFTDDSQRKVHEHGGQQRNHMLLEYCRWKVLLEGKCTITDADTGKLKGHWGPGLVERAKRFSDLDEFIEKDSRGFYSVYTRSRTIKKSEKAIKSLGKKADVVPYDGGYSARGGTPTSYIPEGHILLARDPMPLGNVLKTPTEIDISEMNGNKYVTVKCKIEVVLDRSEDLLVKV